MKKRKEYILICTCAKPKQWNVGCCFDKGGEELLEEFEKAVVGRELTEKVAIRKSGCVNNCSNGVSVRMLNDGTVYSKVETKDDIVEILDKHCEKGEKVERLIEELISDY